MEMEYLNQEKVKFIKDSFEIKKNVGMESKQMNLDYVIKGIIRIILGMVMGNKRIHRDSQQKDIG